VAMKVEGISTIPVDPIRIEGSGVGSPAIAQTSTNRDTGAVVAQKSLQKEMPSAEEIQRDLDVINAQLETMNRSLQFNIDEKLKDIVVKIVDTKTGETIRQIPPDEVLRLREHFKEMVGLIFKETV
jgi:flagellar protein FlaG